MTQLHRAAGALALAASTLTIAAPALAAGQPVQATDWCSYYVTKYPYKGWGVGCIDPDSDGVAGWTSEATHQIRIVRGMDQRTTQQALGHEYAHAESADFPATAKQWWAEQLGQPKWQIQEYLKSPNEVWAEARSKCMGWHDGSRGAGYTAVACDLVDQMLARVKADKAKAAAADKPVNTGPAEETKSPLVVQVAWDEGTQRYWAWTWRWDQQSDKWVAVSYAPAA